MKRPNPRKIQQVAAAEAEEGEVAQATWPTLGYLGGVCGPDRYSVVGGFLHTSWPVSRVSGYAGVAAVPTPAHLI